MPKLTAEDGRWHTVVFDIDGVLACNAHRIHHIFEEAPDWETYNQKVLLDPELPLVHLARYLHMVGTNVVLLTNRNAGLRENTEQWLREHGVSHDILIMRGDEGFQFSYEDFKRQTMLYISQNFIIHAIFEDHPRLVQEFEEMNFPVVYIHSGYYDVGLDDRAVQATHPPTV